MFQSTHSGIHGNSILIVGESRAGAIVPIGQKDKTDNCTFVIIPFAAQHTDHNNGNYNDQHGGYYGNY